MALLTIKVPANFSGGISISNSEGDFSIFEEKQPIGTKPYELHVWNFTGDINATGNFNLLRIDDFVGRYNVKTTAQIKYLSLHNSVGDFDIRIPAKTKGKITSYTDITDNDAIELHYTDSVKIEKIEDVNEWDTYLLVNGGGEATIDIGSPQGKLNLRFVE
jgi:hypothetical protein